MKQIVQYLKDGRLCLAEVPETPCKAGGMLVANPDFSCQPRH